MAEQIGSIEVVASINTKQYDAAKKSIEKGNDELEKGAKDTSNSFSNAWTGAIAGVAASLTNKLLGTISSLTGDMTDLYDASIKFPKVLETMGASGDFASGAFDDMKKYADETIYSLQDMTNTYGSLYGIVGADSGKLVTALGGVSTLAANASQSMGSWSLQLTQMVAKPMVAWQDFRILLEQNPAAISKIAESMGKTTSQLVTDVNEGTLTTSDFLAALNEVGNDESLQEAATASDTFANSTGQLEASIASAGAKMLDTFGPTIIGLINGFGDAITNVSDSVADFAGWMQQGGAWQDVIKGIAVAIAAVVTALTLYTTVVRIAAAIQAVFNAVMSANPIGLIILAIVALVAVLIYFFSQTKIGKKIWEAFVDFLGLAVSKIAEFFTSAWDTIKNVWSGVTDFFNGIWNGIKSAFGAVTNWFKDTFQKAWEGVKNVFSAGGKVFDGIKDGISSVFKTVVNGIISGINTVIKLPFETVNGALNTLRNLSIAGAKPFGFLPTIPVPQIPKLATGGIATGPTLAMIGEGSESEAVIPLSKLDAMLNSDDKTTAAPNVQVTLNMSGIMTRSKADERSIAKQLIEAVNQELRAKGVAEIGNGALRGMA